MFESYSDCAKKVIALAQQEAHRFNCEYVGTEHLLWGLLKERSGIGANALGILDVTLRKVRIEVEKITSPRHGQTAPGKLPYTPHVRNVMAYAAEECKNLNHNLIGPEHLLLGLIREEHGVAAQILMNFNLTLEQVRETTLGLLNNLAI